MKKSCRNCANYLDDNGERKITDACEKCNWVVIAGNKEPSSWKQKLPAGKEQKPLACEGGLKMGTEQIKELVEALYKHHEDYTQGKTQDFSSVCCNCKKAADVISQLLEHTEPEENVRALKECIVRLAMRTTGIKVE